MVLKSKRGLGHMEFIFSLLIFLSFMGIALFFFAPRGSTNVVEGTLDYGFNSVKNNLSVKVDIYSVKLKDSGIINIPIDGVEIINGMERVEDEDGNLLKSKREGNSVYVESLGNEFVYLQISEDFIGGDLMGRASENSSRYEISSFNSKKVLSIKNLRKLKEMYDLDYNSLKKEFKFPEVIDFGFKIVLNGDEIVADRDEGKSEVFSKIERLEILSENGESVFGDLIVGVW